MFRSKDVAPENMAWKDVAFSGSQSLSSWLNAEAFSKSDAMSRTDDTSHLLTRPSKAAAATNISAIVVTEDVSQLSRF
jgi:hypothetical protein